MKIVKIHLTLDVYDVERQIRIRSMRIQHFTGNTATIFYIRRVGIEKKRIRAYLSKHKSTRIQQITSAEYWKTHKRAVHRKMYDDSSFPAPPPSTPQLQFSSAKSVPFFVYSANKTNTHHHKRQ